MDIAQTFMTFMERGGFIMWPLLLLSVIAFAVILERALFWMRVHGSHGQAIFLGLLDRLHAGDRSGTSALLRTSSSPYARLAKMLLRSNGDQALAVSAAEEVRPSFERGLIILSTVVTAAPMLGILGTVVGIIQSFELLGGDASISDPRQVSGGIAEALITTASGLVVALIALFPYMVFQGQQERALGRMESLIASAIHGLSGSTPSQDSQSDSNAKTIDPES
jgi:biopolymer transport protein ExbB